MLTVVRRSSWPLLVLFVSLLAPSAAYAQGAITGVVKDASGAVLPGGTVQGGTAMIHGGRANDTRIYADGVNMGWAGTGGGGGQMPQVAAAQEVVMTVSGGLAEAETGGVVFNAVPRDGSNNFSGQFNF